MERKIEFRKVQTTDIPIGTEVTLSESSLRTLSGIMYYYTVEPALAMSNNTKERLKNLNGTVTSIREDGSEWILTVTVTEPDR